MKATERFLKYISIYTGSHDGMEVTPSSPTMFDLANLIAEEMKALGMSDVKVDEHSYVYGFLPATPGYEDCKAVGFNAHLDVVDDMGDGEPHPQIIENYDGGDITLGESGRVLSPSVFPHLADCKGKTVITTDGTTVLGADDKAGIAAVMTMVETLLTTGKPHGKICVCFSPDEEIGHGAAYLDLDYFGAYYGFTVDGEGPEGIEYETFNAAEARLKFTGFSVHPGSAKDKMINAALVAMEFDSMLPKYETPRDTSGYEGFYHLCDMKGECTEAEMMYIIRDHDKQKFAQRQEVMEDIARKLNKKYGEGTVELTITQQYQNMAEIVTQYPEMLDKAREAVRRVGLEPVSHPVRGGTDGAQLSFRGLPCPNLGAGGYGFHGPYEHLIVEELDTCVDMLLQLVDLFSQK